MTNREPGIRDNDNQVPTQQRGRKWGGGQAFVTGNTTEQHRETPKKNIVQR
jgi:hypothetical protein